MDDEALTLADEDLARRAQEGCLDSFEELVGRYERRLFEFVRRRVGNRRDAEDIVQDSFVKAYRGLGGFDSERRFAPWLYTIARRAVAGHYRSTARLVSGAPGQLDDEPDGAPGPAAGLAAADDGRGLWEWARNLLGEAEFTAMWLRLREDFSLAETAVAMGKSVVATKVALHRARKRLVKAWPPPGWVGREAVK